MRDMALAVIPGLLLLTMAQSGTPARSRTSPRNPLEGPYQITSVCIAAPQTGRATINVSNGEELQAALDRANPGDTILLAPGTTFRPSLPEGSFVLRNRPVGAGQWITIRSGGSAFDAGGAVPPGTRVQPGDAPRMAMIRVKTANRPAIRADLGARGYRLVGLDVGVDAEVTSVTNLIELGGATDTSVDTEPSDIVIDRCYVHGNDTGNFRRGVALNGVRMAVIDSHFDNFHDAGTDSQAIAGWNGPGPFKIVNNYLEAASENIMFGGGDPAVQNLVPSDIEIRRNLSTKRMAWRSAGIAAKNAFELKNARRVLVEGNVFENVWPSGQDGTAILLKSVNQNGRCTWCVTEYVTFRDNIVRGAANGLLINAAETGERGQPMPPPANNIRIQNVLFDDIGGAAWGGGKLFRIFGGVPNVEVTHVTSTSNPQGILDPRATSDTNPGLTFKYNIVERMYYGIGAGSDEGTTTVSRNFAPFVYNQNVLVNTSGSTNQAISDNALKARYPPVTHVVSNWKSVGFDEGTHKLSTSSAYYHAGDDGKDLGADMDAIAAAQAGPSSYDCEGTAVPRR